MDFNWVDLVILFLLVSAGVHGLMQGAAVQVFSYAGFGVGLLLGAKIGPALSPFVQSPGMRIVVVIAALFGTAAIMGTVGKFIGAKATWAVPKASPLGVVNSVGGLGVAVLATLITTWLIGGMLAQVPIGEIGVSMNESRIVRGLTQRLPPAPAVFSSIQRNLLPSGFPPVFAELEPSPAPPVAVEGTPDLTNLVASVRESVVKISSAGCGRITSGSGFVAAPGLVITNAHVVAGVDRPTVQDGNGMHRTTVVLFDPDLDLAFLRTSGLAGEPLPLASAEADRGVQGAVLGFPGGGQFTVEPGVVRSLYRDAVGRDIYSRNLVSRDVYQLDADVQAGNSGGPFVDLQGRVAGVIFASSLVNPEIAYALTATEVAVRLDQARAVTGSVGTGSCTR